MIAITLLLISDILFYFKGFKPAKKKTNS